MPNSQSSSDGPQIRHDFAEIWEGRFGSAGPSNAAKSMDTVGNDLRKILGAWDDDCGRTMSEKLVLLLQHELPFESSSMASLTGMDAFRTALVSSIAEELGFGLGIASLVLYKCGRSNDSYNRYLRREVGAKDDEVEGSVTTDPSEANLSFVSDDVGVYDFEDEYYTNSFGYTGPQEDLRVERFGNLDGSLVRYSPRTRLAAYRAYKNHSKDRPVPDSEDSSDSEDTGEEQEDSVEEEQEARRTVDADVEVKVEEDDHTGVLKREDDTDNSVHVKMEDFQQALLLKTEPKEEDKLAELGVVQDEDSLVIDLDFEGVPAKLNEAIKTSVRKGNHQTYDGFDLIGDDYVGGPLHRWYYKTALVIWPSYTKRLVRDQESVGSICASLGTGHSSNPTADERKLARYLVHRHSQTKDARAVLEGVTAAACRWNDIELWIHAVQTCAPRGGLLSADEVQRAFLAFGFPSTNHCVANMLLEERDNTRIALFFRTLRHWLQDPDWDPQLDIKSPLADVSAWIEEHALLFETSLRIAKKNDFETLKKLAEESGNEEKFWSERVLPQIIPKSRYNTLKSYAKQICQEGSSQMSREASRSIAEKLLEGCVPLFDLCPKYVDHSWKLRCLTELEEFIQTCIEFGCLKAAVAMVSKLINVDELPRMLEGLDNPSASFVSALGALQQFAVSAYFTLAEGGGKIFCTKNLFNIFHVIFLPGGQDLMLDSITSHLTILRQEEAHSRCIVEALHQVAPQAVNVCPSISSILTAEVQNYAQLASIDTPAQAADALELCLRLGVPDGFWGVMKRITDPADLASRFSPASNVPDPQNAFYERKREGQGTEIRSDTEVVTLMGMLRTMLAQYPLGDADDASAAFSSVLRAWMHSVLGPVPADASDNLAKMKTWKASCACEPCATLQAFFLERLEFETTVPKLLIKQRQHVEKCLDQYVTRAMAEWSWGGTMMRVLTIKKTPAFTAHVLWHARKAIAAQMLREISSDVEEQVYILGDEYMDFGEWMRGLSDDEASRRITSSQDTAAATQIADGGRKTARADKSEEREAPPSKKQRVI